jgi:RNA ligase
MKFDLDILNGYIERGLVDYQDHPTLPLRIYNYTRTCQFEKMWDDITLMCRGLVLDHEGNVVAYPLKKFFNIEELDSIPNEPYDIYAKMDGSLGIVFHYADEWHVATRGSFTSEQAIKGAKMLKKCSIEKLNKDNTYLFEIIYNSNRIVCRYDFEDLILLTSFNTNTGEELGINDYHKIFKTVGQYRLVVKDFKKLKNEIKNNEEGFVIRFKSGLRMKIKGEEYCRLHSLLTQFSNVDIWKCLSNGDDFEQFLDRVPDEFDAWVRLKVKELQYAKYSISEHCGKIHDYFRYGKYSDVYPEPTKKEFAEHLERCNIESYYRPILFKMWDKKPYDDIIWKLIRPRYEKPFWNKDID